MFGATCRQLNSGQNDSKRIHFQDLVLSSSEVQISNITSFSRHAGDQKYISIEKLKALGENLFKVKDFQFLFNSVIF